MTKILSKFPALLLALVVGLFCSSSAFATATIVIQNMDAPNVGFNDQTPAAPIGGNNGSTIGEQRLNAFQFAANIWGATLPDGPVITVRASWAALPCTANSATLGSAGTTSLFRNFANAPVANTWYSVALANALSGTDLNGSSAEISARFNFNVGTTGCLQNKPWYYGLDNAHGSARVNLVTVLLHEFAHGLGFQSFTDEETGEQASGFPGIFDRFLFDNTTGKTWVQMTDAERVTSAINTGNLVWNGPQVVSDASLLTSGKDSSGRPRVFAPEPVDGGSSISHWDTIAAPNQLMEPNINTNLTHSVTTPQDLTFSLMRDIGWCLTCPPPPPPPPPGPPPANDNFAAAQSLVGCSGSITSTNVSATKESGEPNHDPLNTTSNTSVWYQWQAPVTSSVTLTTAGTATDFDTMLAVYTGNSVNSLVAVIKNDDVSSNNQTSSVTFNATAGTIYKIAVDGWGGGSGHFVLNWTQSSCTTGSTAIFSQTSLSIGEGGGSASLNIIRANTSTAENVDYATSDTFPISQTCQTVNTGVASSRCDYATSIGTLRFAAGEASKTIFIPIIDDNISDGNENFTVTLKSGATTLSTATITITDNANTAGNPIDTANFFIRQHYIDFLGREPDPSGYAGWLNVYNNCGTTIAQPCDRIEISSAFFRSSEFQDRASFVYRFYSAVGKIPLYEGFMPDFAKVSGFLTAQELEANKVAFVNEFMTRADYQNLYGSISGNDAYVTALLTTLGLPNHTRKTEWVNALNGGTTRAVVLRSVTEDGQVSQKYYTEAFVIMQYFGYLRRSADASYKQWIETMNSNGGDYRLMINGFLNSAEYRNRFQ